ncbi:NAD(P)-dependent oxidoreductase [Arthrobacter sp. NPDC056493]|uniref:NAD(P)-dependent oxidoreductase n=1 Tax=Arthrobacter sp. NPDC056493 TaxID=3345839 RepID=UPI00366CE5BD
MSIGYIGLGNMGGALARRIVREHEVTVYDMNPDAVQGLVASGAKAASTPAAVAATCDTILLCLPTSRHVRSALFDNGGLAESLRTGTIVIDQTTGDPSMTREIAKSLEAKGVTFIDAPVSGGPTKAEEGTIAIMVGSSLSQFEHVLPVLRSISPNIFHAGEVGAGQTVKLVNNMVSATQRLVSLEAMTLAVKNGLDPRKVVEILVASGGRNAYLERFMVPQIIEGRMNVAFTLGLTLKDLNLACQLGTDSGVPLLYGNVTRDVMQASVNEFGPNALVDTVAGLVDRAAGTRLVGTESADKA